MSKQQQVSSNLDLYGEEETVNLKDFVIGALVGGIVGAAAGLLLAPKTGRDLRSDVATQAVTLKEKGVELSSTAKDKTVQLSSQLKEQSTHLVDKVKSKTQKTSPILDDGTVSFEGEEPLDMTFEEENKDADIVVESAEDTADIEEAVAESKHTSI